MEKKPKGKARGSRDDELEGLYKQLAHSAARLMVVHEASTILRSSNDPEELAKGVLSVIAEALFAGSGCVASLDGNELKILAVHKLDDHEADALATNEQEAGVWFEVVDGAEPRRAEELAETLGLGARGAETGDEDAAGEAGSGLREEDVEGQAPAVEDEGPEGWGWAEGESREEGSEKGREEIEEPGEPEEEDCDWGKDDVEDDGDSAAPVFSLYMPLKIEEETLGVLALGSRIDGQPFAEEDELLASALCTHLALALNHAALFVERNKRIDQLSVLLQISREITSTLDLEKVLTTICHMVGMLVPNVRATVALSSGSTVDIRASSDPSLKGKSASKDPLLPVLRWAHGARRMINTCLEDTKVDPEGRESDPVAGYLSRDDGPRGLTVIPLEDDQGVLGVLAIETAIDAPPADEDNEELLTVLANQTTVAIRNAELYQRIPMIGMLEPVLGRARRGVSDRRKLLSRFAVPVAIVALGTLIPLPSWVSGDATIRPAVPVPLRAATEGIVDEVLVSEGDLVSQGEVLARLRKDELELELEQVRAAAQGVRVEAARARNEGDLAGFRANQAALNDLFQRESFLLKEVERTELVAPTDGFVLTKDIEMHLGERLDRGQTFLDLADLTIMEVEVAVEEKDVQRVIPGRSARFKVHAYPGRTFRGEIVQVAPRASADGTFRVTVQVVNDDGALMPGMTGRAHLDAPGRPILRTALDPLINRLRLKVWL